MITTALICVLVAIIIGYYLRIKWKLTAWRRQGIEQMDHNLFEVGEQYLKTYHYLRKKGARFGGSYMFYEKQFIPADLDLIKDMLQTNFSHFVNHGLPYDEQKDPLSAHLFNLENERWRVLRQKLTPTFTSGKMKMMFPTVVDTTPGLIELFDQSAKLHDPLEAKDVLARFTTDVIGTVAFGIDCNSIKNPDSEFRRQGSRIFHKIGVRMIIRFILPSFLHPLMIVTQRKPNPNEKSPQEFFTTLVRDMISYREKNNVQRTDFFQLLLQLKNKGRLDDDNDDISDEKLKSASGKLTFNEIAAQCFIFFLGGFETSSTTMTFALYELAADQDVQNKLRKELREALAKNGGKMTYDVVMNIEYLDRVINETLRLHPPVRFLMRICNKDYHVPDSDVIIPNGARAIIPVDAIHRDPEFFPNPDKFDPDRFSPENKAHRHPMAYQPFGEGPRMCIGSRFAFLQSKIGLTSILSKYRVKLNKKTHLPLRIEKAFTVNAIEGGLWLDVEKVD